MPEIISERADGSRRVQYACEGESMTEQSHAKKTNINSIVARVRRTGLWPQRKEEPTYGDFSSATSFHDAQEAIRKANGDFMRLPSAVRERFGHDAGELIGFLANKDNAQEAIELGLIPDPEKAEQFDRDRIRTLGEAIGEAARPPEATG